MTPKAFSVGMAAQRLGVSTKTIKRWWKSGKLAGAYRTVGGHLRFPREAVESLVRSDESAQPSSMAMTSARACSVDGCHQKHAARGYCLAHYARASRGLRMDTPIRPTAGGGVTLADIFWPRVRKGSPEECWLWAGATSASGYGILSVAKSKRAFAHRTAWVLSNGEIPKGMLVCHRCDNPPCVNPGHLFLGTHKDNAHDMIEKGRSKLYRRQPRQGQGAV